MVQILRVKKAIKICVVDCLKRENNFLRLKPARNWSPLFKIIYLFRPLLSQDFPDSDPNFELNNHQELFVLSEKSDSSSNFEFCEVEVLSRERGLSSLPTARYSTMHESYPSSVASRAAAREYILTRDRGIDLRFHRLLRCRRDPLHLLPPSRPCSFSSFQIHTICFFVVVQYTHCNFISFCLDFNLIWNMEWGTMLLGGGRIYSSELRKRKWNQLEEFLKRKKQKAERILKGKGKCIQKSSLEYVFEYYFGFAKFGHKKIWRKGKQMRSAKVGNSSWWCLCSLNFLL